MSEINGLNFLFVATLVFLVILVSLVILVFLVNFVNIDQVLIRLMFNVTYVMLVNEHC